MSVPLLLACLVRGLSMARIRHRRLLFYLGLFVLSTIVLVNFVLWFDTTPIGPASESIHESDDDVTKNLITDDSSDEPDNIFKHKWDLAKPWFMSNGTIKASNRYTSRLALWPDEIDKNSLDPNTDRIINQLMYVPQGYNPKNYVPKGKLPLKRILLFFGKNGWGDLNLGRGKFLQDKCPVNSCSIEDNADMIERMDAVIFKDRFVWPKQGRSRMNQVWILFLLECPMHTQMFNSLDANIFNWTATYRHDSDLVTPYEKFLSYESLLSLNRHNSLGPRTINSNGLKMNISDYLFESPTHISSVQRNYALGKTRKVAWFVSNCGARNKRLEYARELSKHISVDIFGSCGRMKCPRSKAADCFEMLNQNYKFYLAFENSNCRDYITEKFFINGLGRAVPIVMGALREDYRRSSPLHSFIHVDDFDSPASLAHYLNKLDANDSAYNEYFEWKHTPTGEFINTYFWCRLCALLHAPPHRQKFPPSYENIAQWWAPKNICMDGSNRWPTH